MFSVNLKLTSRDARGTSPDGEYKLSNTIGYGSSASIAPPEPVVLVEVNFYSSQERTALEEIKRIVDDRIERLAAEEYNRINTWSSDKQQRLARAIDVNFTQDRRGGKTGWDLVGKYMDASWFLATKDKPIETILHQLERELIDRPQSVPQVKAAPKRQIADNTNM